MDINSKKIILIVIALAFIGALGWFLFAGSRRDGEIAEPTYRPVPDLRFKDYEGKEIALSDFRGKPMVVNAWAAWCPFCADELADFGRLQEEFGDKLVVVAIARAESLEVAKSFTDKVGVTGKIIFLLDSSDSFYSSIGGFSMPETIFVDEQGFIKEHKRGPMSLEEMRRRVKQAFGL